MLTIEIDWHQAELVFGKLLAALKAKKFPYPYVSPPNAPYNLPSNLELGGIEHTNFLWNACYYMKGGIKSHTAIASLSKLYAHDPTLFDPNQALKRHPTRFAKKITRSLQSFGLGFSSEMIGLHWVLNARKLARFWSGNPANLFRSSSNYEQLCSLIIRGKSKKFNPDIPIGFLGFREKMVSMITYFLMFAEIVEFSIFPVPVDFHVLRLLVSHGVIKIVGMKMGESILSDELLAKGREVTVAYCDKHGVSPMDLCDALWLLSSTICRKHPGNQSIKYKYRTRKGKKLRRGKVQSSKPTDQTDLFGETIQIKVVQEIEIPKDERLRYEARGRKTVLEPTPITWSPSQVRAYENSCGLCPIESTCQYCIPAAHYYIRGEVYPRSLRQRPPVENLLLKVDH